MCLLLAQGTARAVGVLWTPCDISCGTAHHGLLHTRRRVPDVDHLVCTTASHARA